MREERQIIKAKRERENTRFDLQFPTTQHPAYILYCIIPKKYVDAIGAVVTGTV